MLKTRDYSKIDIGIGDNGIFINTNMIRAYNIPFSQIEKLEETPHLIKIMLKDYSNLLKHQFFVVRPFLKKKYIGKAEAIIIPKASFNNSERYSAYEYINKQIIK